MSNAGDGHALSLWAWTPWHNVGLFLLCCPALETCAVEPTVNASENLRGQEATLPSGSSGLCCSRPPAPRDAGVHNVDSASHSLQLGFFSNYFLGKLYLVHEKAFEAESLLFLCVPRLDPVPRQLPIAPGVSGSESEMN